MKVDKHIRDAAEKWVHTESIAKDTYEVERAFKAGAKYALDTLNQANDATDTNGTCAIAGVSVSLPSTEQSEAFLREFNFHPHANQSLKVMTEDSEGAYLDKKDISNLINCLIVYIGNER